MPLWFHGGKLILFAHVPKTGGSALFDYLVRRLGLPMLGPVDPAKLRGTGLVTNPEHFTKKDIANCVAMDALDYSFAFVRNPLNRLMSEYRYQSGISRSSRLSFSSWAHLTLGSARREPRIYQNHIRPQTDFIPDQADIFHLEDGFDPLIRKLDEVLESPGPQEGVPFFNVTRPVAIELSRQDADLVGQFYAADYDRFGYAPRSSSEFRSDPLAFWRKAQANVIAPALIAWQRHNWIRQPKSEDGK